jgi:hypothetical protein
MVVIARNRWLLPPVFQICRFLYNRIRNTTPRMLSILSGLNGQVGDSFVVALVTCGNWRLCSNSGPDAALPCWAALHYSPQQITLFQLPRSEYLPLQNKHEIMSHDIYFHPLRVSE